MYSGKDVRKVKKILEEASKRLFPVAITHLAGSKAGIAATIVVYATWFIKTLYRKYEDFSISEEVRKVAEILNKIKELEAEKEGLKETREKLVKEGRNTELVDKKMIVVEKTLEELRREWELRQLRIMAWRYLESLGDPRIMEAVKEMIKKIKKGKEFEEQQYKVLKELKERWERREIEINVLREILEHA